MTAAQDLAGRWRRARRAALVAVVPGASADTSEDELLVQALDCSADDTLRRLFDVSLRLGQSFRAYYRLELPLADVVRLLPELEVPCAARTWAAVPGEAAQRAERAPCDAWSRHPRACEAWREAIHGLALGVTGEVRFARHASRGAGDPRCVDVLYVHPLSPARFGPIPDELRPGLDAIRRTARAFDGALEIEFLGLSEGVLYYRAQRASGADGDAGHVTTSIEHDLRRRFPGLVTREVSPRPVFTPDAP